VLFSAACTVHRQLWISEVGAGRLELYLAEDPNASLDLAGHTLEWQANDPSGVTSTGRIDLTGGTVPGGQYVVVWEGAGPTGAVTPSNFNNFHNQSVLGLETAPGALGPTDSNTAYAFRVHERHSRYVFPIFYETTETDDEVRFGPGTRPNLGGSFSEDHMALDQVDRTAAVGLTKGRTIRRKTVANAANVDIPVDRNREADWQTDDESYGAPD
jgi:hypothetical protein